MQRDCRTDDPKKFAAWAWAAGIPDPSPARPDPIPLIAPQLTEGLSQMLWDLGFRHHPNLQKKWINGAAGLGMCAQLVDKKPEEDPIDKMAEDFLSDTNPKLLEAIKKAPPEEKERLLKELEKNFGILEGLIERIRATMPTEESK